MQGQTFGVTLFGGGVLALLWLLAFVSNERQVAETTARSTAPVVDHQDARIRLGSWIAIAYLVAIGAALLGFVPLGAGRASFVAGCALIVFGAALRRSAHRALGQSFTLDVRVVPFVATDEGGYLWLRHPAYFGGLLMLAGVGLCLGSALSVVALVGVGLWVYVRRIVVEERALIAAHGRAYVRWSARRWRLVPFIW